ncbi:signal peptide peptidase SppA [Oryzibacter oryziterrae]|uniref:signal peptide peptidase SppA n=1 Tax=Oryzibacter oryziterrae TaxID=2766474 RepID=UPI001F00DD3D|nr:signal peptide peptidase SppA [Oryzibacter oryziterrae]
MALDADLMVDRRRTRRKLVFWRAAAFVVAALAVVVIALLNGGDELAGRNRQHIARISVQGMILSDAKVNAMLKELAEQDEVKGVIVAIDSPGGSTVGGEELYDGIRKIAARKPVVATMGTLAASAGYMTAIAADHIVAERSTITGSIGVLFQYGNAGRLLQTLGIEVKTLKSAPLKAEPSPFTYPEQPGAAAMIQRLIDDTYAWFVDIVAERRKLDRAEALKLADGSVYSGRQALTLKLVDEIGGEDAAIAWLEQQKDMPKDLPVLDWAPARPFDGFNFGSMALATVGNWIGIDLSSLRTQPALDGLVSVWHPQGPDIQ